MEKILIATGSRSEWGVLSPLVSEMKHSFDVHTLAVASHLSPTFGFTLPRDDNVHRVETLMSSDTEVGVCKSMGVGFISICEALLNIKPRIVVIEGDRSEMIPIATCAFNLGIPVAHISGGDITTGSKDNAYRDCITRLSTLHFTDTQQAAQRVKEIIGHDTGVHFVGSLSLYGLKLYDGLRSGTLVCLHPADDVGPYELSMVVELSRKLCPPVICSTAGPDPGGRAINNLLKITSENNALRLLPASTDRDTFLDCLGGVKVAIGNSSAVVVEAPALGTPSVLIGKRQDGRPLASSIVKGNPSSFEHVKSAIRWAVETYIPGRPAEHQPYEYQDTINKIISGVGEFLCRR